MRIHVVLGATLSGAIVLAAAVLAQGSAAQCAADNGGITLPAGFCASVFADKLGQARHMAVSPAGALYVALRRGSSATAQGVVALRDADKDGRAEIVERSGTGAASSVDAASADAASADAVGNADGELSWRA